MRKLDKETKFAHLGKPGSAFSKGFQRRLDILTELIDFEDKKILDLGCGEGVWLKQLLRFTDAENIFGCDVDEEKVNKLKNDKKKNIPNKNLRVCPGEDLPFEENSFDIVFSNEVLEHVDDDVQTVKECLRVLKPGGKFIIFTPNRGWPFETHGAFFRGKYYWGNIPLLPWMPKFVFKKFAPHVRNYSNGELKRVVKKAGGKVIYHKHVFPAFDKLEIKFGFVGRFFQKLFQLLERTPLHWFGISHLMIVEKGRKDSRN